MAQRNYTVPKYQTYFTTPSVSIREAEQHSHSVGSPFRLNVDSLQSPKRTKFSPGPLSEKCLLALELYIYLSAFTSATSHALATRLKFIFWELDDSDWLQLAQMDEERPVPVENLYEKEDVVEEEEDLWTRILSHPIKTLSQRLHELVERIETTGIETTGIVTAGELSFSSPDQQWFMHRGDYTSPLPIIARPHEINANQRSYDISITDPAILAEREAYIAEIQAAQEAERASYKEECEKQKPLAEDKRVKLCLNGVSLDGIHGIQKDGQFVAKGKRVNFCIDGADLLQTEGQFLTFENILEPPCSVSTIVPKTEHTPPTSTITKPTLIIPFPSFTPINPENEQLQLEWAIAQSLASQSSPNTSTPPPDSGYTSDSLTSRDRNKDNENRRRLWQNIHVNIHIPRLIVRNPDQKRRSSSNSTCTNSTSSSSSYSNGDESLKSKLNIIHLGDGYKLDTEAKRLEFQQREKAKDISEYQKRKAKKLKTLEEQEEEELQEVLRRSLQE